tara:strand:- start:1816 stop:2661 length:846 start_codon:yes stop_codon:yes gene_type:complete
MDSLIIKDIYSKLDKLNDGDIDLSEETIEKTGEAIKEVIKQWSSPQPSTKFTVRMSNIGKPLRQLWFDSKESGTASRIPPQTFIKFLYGHLLEEIVLMFVRMTDRKVSDEQKEVSLDGVKGHIDCKIDGEVVDIKTASNFGFKKFADNSLHEKDSFGYLMQLAAYETAEDSSKGGFIAINKETGELTSYEPGELVKPNARYKIEQIKQVLQQDNPPDICYPPVPEGKSGNMKLDTNCVYCPHKYTCWQDSNGGVGLRVFKYANGLKYLTRVAVLPKVDEVA